MQSILLPEADVAVLRAAVALPLFAPLLSAVPGLAAGLQHPQPDFGPYLPLVDDAVGEVRSNTNYPEDWDDLSEAVDEARQARQQFRSAQEAAEPASPKSIQAFVLMERRLGTNDGPSFGQTAYLDYVQACAELRAKAYADFDPELDEDLTLEEHGGAGTQNYGIDLVTKSRGSLVTLYCIKAFNLSTRLTETVEAQA